MSIYIDRVVYDKIWQYIIIICIVTLRTMAFLGENKEVSEKRVQLIWRHDFLDKKHIKEWITDYGQSLCI